MKIITFLILLLYFNVVFAQPLVVVGDISSLPVYQHHHLQFDFKTAHGLWRCYWYGHAQSVKPGERWQLLIKTTPWQQLIIPYGFSFGEYLKHKGYAGSCSVKGAKENIKRGASFWRDPIDKIRYHVRSLLDHLIYHYRSKGIMMALIIGDRSGLTKKNWQVFQATGTSHLVAISGLHIGLVAFVAYWVAKILMSLSYSLLNRGWVLRASLIISFLAALVYSTLAGFSVPTTRALLMIACVIAAKLIGLRLNDYLALATAWILMLLFDLKALYFAGAWLSFSAVFVLIYGYRHYQPHHWLLKLIYPQLLVFLGLAPLTLYWFSKISLVAMLVNMVAIPVVSFVIVPLLFLASLMLFVPFIAQYLFALANHCLELFWLALSFVANFKGVVVSTERPSLFVTILSTIAVLLIIKCLSRAQTRSAR